MREVDINTLVDINNYLNKNIPNDIIIIGKIDKINIIYKYIQLDLSKVKCDKIEYWYQEEENIKNHILPNSLIELYCNGNKLTSLPELPNSLILLNCSGNLLTSLPKLPNLLITLYCPYNKLTSLPDLPNSLITLYCDHNRLTSLPDLPNSLITLYCDHNRLISLPDFSHIDHELELSFIQDSPIGYIPYYQNIKLYDQDDNKIIVEGYEYNPITNQKELDQYMKYIKNYEMNRIKSARK